MSTNIPRTIPELIDWCNVHDPLFSVNAVAVGLSVSQAAAFHTLVLAFVKANTEAQVARESSKISTLALKGAMEAVLATGGAYVNTIKAFAEITHNNNVYLLSGISPSDVPGVVPEPVAPARFGASINPDGSLTLNWKVAQPVGVTSVAYRVLRRVNTTTGPFVIVSTEGKGKTYTDKQLPYGVDRVEYIVQPVRGGVPGPQSDVFTVQFGSVVGGGLSIHTIAATPQNEAMKIAA